MRAKRLLLVLLEESEKLEKLSQIIEPVGDFECRPCSNLVEANDLLKNDCDQFVAVLIDGTDELETRIQQLSQLDLAVETPLLILLESGKKDLDNVRSIHKDLEDGVLGYQGFIDFLDPMAQPATLRAKIQLLHSLHEKNQELGRLSAKLGEIKERKNEPEHSLATFTQCVAHDLNPPLRHLNSFIDRISQDLQEIDDDSSQVTIGQLLEQMRTSCNRMKRTIDGTREYSIYASKFVRKEIIDVRELFRAIHHEFTNELTSDQIELGGENSIKINADYKKIFVVFQKLIENAIKYRSPKRRIKILVSVSSSVDDVTITVSDNGLGIEEGLQEKVFGFMQRLHTEDEIPGAGIGLAICQLIASSHQGTITLESTVDCGSKFHVTLPKI